MTDPLVTRPVPGEDDDATPTVRVGEGAPTVRVGGTASPEPAATPGQPRFALRGRIGAGNHGVVFRARDQQLHRDVAIKRFSHFLADDPRAMRRITREVAMLARVSHPNVVTVHDLVHLPDGEGEIIPHLVMELVEGTSLRDLLATHGPSPRSVIAVQGVLEGLAACHRADILHLDIKPANVLVTTAGGVKIVDFGIARAASDATATVAGTPHYMAPEQYDGRADQRSDIYSVGCLLYECLTGKPPFEGTMASQLLAHRTQPRPDPRALAPNVSPGLAGVVMRAMAVDPDQRYASVGQMLHALADVETMPVPPPATGTVPVHRPTAPQPRQAPQATAALAPPTTTGPVVTRWNRGLRLSVGLTLSALVIALVPGLVWLTTAIPPAADLRPDAMASSTPWWLLAVGLATLHLLGRRGVYLPRLGGPPRGWPQPERLVDGPMRSGLRQAVGAALRGSVPMLLPWYVLLVAALTAAIDLPWPGDPYESTWTIVWLMMPLSCLVLAWLALARLRPRVGRVLLCLLMLGGSALAAVVFVAYPALAF
ncbi:serine/threonine-protein kinase [Aeromicrobium sp. CF4.19]|uniref:serine/threonine-protein kinase n=1 Tax=Aeromicrobium sp. CF4.19 TaxID=3373082 RepID=UPI003EE631DC